MPGGARGIERHARRIPVRSLTHQGLFEVHVVEVDAVDVQPRHVLLVDAAVMQQQHGPAFERVENSILFRGVKVHKGVHIKNSIIMQNNRNLLRSRVEKYNLYKDVKITSSKHFKESVNYPIIIKKDR